MEDNFQVVSASITDRGLSEKRPQNEDSYLELTQHGIFAVADGVGGAQAGDVASQMAVEILGEAFANKPENVDAEGVMRIAIERANSAIYQMSHDLPQLATMATTIVALHLSGNIATIGHVGDSRAYRVDSSGTISQETADHSVVAEEVRAGRMTPEQAATHPSRNVISRALGAEATVDIDLKTIMVEPNTSFILCSDGITRHIDDWELESILRTDGDLEEKCQKLRQVCYDRGAEDNLTAVVVKVKGEVTAPPEDVFPVEIEEPEEETVAAARSPFDDVAEPIIENNEMKPPSAEVASAEEPVFNDVLELSPVVTLAPLVTEQQAHAAEKVADEAERYGELSRPEAEVIEPATEEVLEPAQVEPFSTAAATAAAPVASAVVARSAYQGEKPSYQKYEEPKPSRTGFFRGFLSSLLLLIVGGALGAAGIYFFFPPQTIVQQQAPPPILVPKSDNPPLTAFEESRRRVDADPTAYLSANKAFDPDADAADFYLRGRAFLRLGNYFEAKQALTEARKRLKPNDVDAATLDTEIALALAVINSGPATESLRKELADWSNTAAANTAANSNSATSNSNAPANALPAGNTNHSVNSNR